MNEINFEHRNASVDKDGEIFTLSARSSNVLKSMEIGKLEDLELFTEDEVARTKKCGKKTLAEIKWILGEFGMNMRKVKKYETKED